MRTYDSAVVIGRRGKDSGRFGIQDTAECNGASLIQCQRTVDVADVLPRSILDHGRGVKGAGSMHTGR